MFSTGAAAALAQQPAFQKYSQNSSKLDFVYISGMKQYYMYYNTKIKKA